MNKSIKSKKELLPKRWGILAAASFTFGVILFIIAYIGMRQQVGIGQLNQPILTWMVNHRSGVVSSLAKFITSIANPYIFAIIVALIVISWILLKREIWRPVVLTGAVGVAAGTSTLLKPIIMYSRPPQINMVPTFEYDFSFPSGHTISIAVLLLVLGYLIYSRKYSVQKFWTWIAVAIVGTGLIGFSRLYLGYHWLTDVVASAGLALIILAVVIVVDMFVVKRFFSDTDR